jgi:hypothetical protein
MYATNVLILAANIPLDARAQESSQITRTFTAEKLSGKVERGDDVIVTQGNGVQVKGKVVRLEADGLTLLSAGQERLVPWSVISRIEEHDSLWNGAGWGTLAGAALGVMADSGSCSPKCDSQIPAQVLYLGLLGAGVGAFFDWMIPGYEIVAGPVEGGRRVELSPGYQVLHVSGDSPETSSTGLSLELERSLTRRIGMVFHTDWSHKAVEASTGQVSFSTSQSQYLVGIRANLRSDRTVVPFTRCLMGALLTSSGTVAPLNAHQSTLAGPSVSATDFTVQAGGGVNVVMGHVRIRVGADFLRLFVTHPSHVAAEGPWPPPVNHVSTNGFRVVAGAVVVFSRTFQILPSEN